MGKIYQRGSALIIALLVMTLTATLATAMILTQEHALETTSIWLENDKLVSDSRLVDQWAQNFLLTHTNIDHTEFPNITLPDGTHLSGKIIDLQSKFNLNNLIDINTEKQFSRLIILVEPKVNSVQANAIAQAVHEWVSAPYSNKINTLTANKLPQPATAIDSKINQYYAARSPGYRAAQMYMASASELRLVKGVTANLYLHLSPFIIALPKVTPININTASAPLLASLGHGMDLDTANQLIESHEDFPYPTTQNFLADPAIARLAIKENSITVSSQYFLVKAQAEKNQKTSHLNTLLVLNTTDSSPKITILWQTRGPI